MIIVIIHWKIKLGEEHRQGFLRHWAEKLAIKNKSRLVGEFLSEPLSADKAGFLCGLLGLPASSAYQSFFNVGIWTDLESFDREIIKPYVGLSPRPEEFEFEYRERMVLAPLSRRRGAACLPGGDEVA